MSFNKNSRLDPSQVQDRRGMSTGTRVAVGGGGIGILILLVALLLGVNPGDLVNTAMVEPSYSDPYAGEISDLATECQTGADANTRTDCALVGYVNSIQAFWSDVFAEQGIQYAPAQTVLYSGATEAACGYAQGAMGPFYCTLDQQVYLDLSFFDTLQQRFGAGGGPFAMAYVVSHEYSHHIQDLLGILEPGGQGPQSMTVYTELQADCLAGVWAHHSQKTKAWLEPGDIEEGMNAASKIGDDTLQRQSQGTVVPESFTHGSSKQRVSWFRRGLERGDPDACDTFAAGTQ